MPPDNAVVFKRKLSDALILSLTEPGKHAARWLTTPPRGQAMVGIQISRMGDQINLRA